MHALWFAVGFAAGIAVVIFIAVLWVLKMARNF